MALRDAAVQELLKTLHETLPLFDQTADVLKRAYAPDKWNLRQILVHLSDAETVLLDRLRRLAAENNPTLVAFNQDLWTSAMRSEERDLTLSRIQYEVARRNVIELARLSPADFEAKTGTHTEAGKISFGDVLSKVHKHNAHHLEQARAIVAGTTWTPKKP